MIALLIFANFAPMYKIEYILVKFFLTITALLPIAAGKWIALFVRFIVHHILRYRRRVILHNLRLVYGDRLPDKEHRLLKNIYKNFVFLWFEFLQNPRLNEKNINEHVRFHNPEILLKALGQNRGVVLVSGHMGNFEWLGQAVGIMGYSVSGIAKRQSNPYVNKLIEKNRKQYNVSVIYKKNAIADALKVMKENNEVIGIVADQNAYKRGVEVEFLGQPSSTAVGPAVLHLRSGAPLLFGITIRRDYGLFDCYIQKIEIPKKGKTDDQLIREITQKHAHLLEEWIYEYPEQWFWMHKRWKVKG